MFSRQIPHHTLSWMTVKMTAYSKCLSLGRVLAVVPFHIEMSLLFSGIYFLHLLQEVGCCVSR